MMRAPAADSGLRCAEARLFIWKTEHNEWKFAYFIGSLIFNSFDVMKKSGKRPLYSPKKSDFDLSWLKMQKNAANWLQATTGSGLI